MITIFTTKSHRYTHQSVANERSANVRVVSYEDLNRTTELPRATYIFTDVDRLIPKVRVHAAQVFRQLQNAGAKVLNDPARMLSRFGLLRALHRAGLNEFDAYRVENLEEPRRWPVFLRVEGTHAEPVSGLLNTPAELDAAIEKAVGEGSPRSALLVIEYAAEPVLPGLFRKLSAFRVGERLLGYTCAHDNQWIVKYGQPGIAPPELYEEEYGFVAECPFADLLLKVFDIAGVDYGRIDYGLVDGRPQIFEINSNPDLKLRPEASPVARRNESNSVFTANYLEALKAIDTPPMSGAMAQTVGATR